MKCRFDSHSRTYKAYDLPRVGLSKLVLLQGFSKHIDLIPLWPTRMPPRSTLRSPRLIRSVLAERYVLPVFRVMRVVSSCEVTKYLVDSGYFKLIQVFLQVSSC